METAASEPATATESGEAKCDRCFNRYPVLFSMCRPCMDEVAPPSIQPPGEGRREDFHERLGRARKWACGWTSRWGKIACPGLDEGEHSGLCDSLTYSYDDTLQDHRAAVTRAHTEGRADMATEAAKMCRDAQAKWQENAEMTKPGKVINARDRLQGQANAARVLAGQISRLAVTPDGGAAKGTGK